MHGVKAPPASERIKSIEDRLEFHRKWLLGDEKVLYKDNMRLDAIERRVKRHELAIALLSGMVSLMLYCGHRKNADADPSRARSS